MPELVKSTMTNFKKPKERICKICKQPIRLDGGITHTVFTTLSINFHPWCLRKKQKRKKRRLKMCLECRSRPRAKKGTKCATCRRKYDVNYWADKAWKVFSEYVRSSAANFGGYTSCYTCKEVKPWRDLQAGHCFHRGRQSYRAIDFDPEHVRPQCGGCNGPQGGKTNTFQLNLIDELGLEEVKEMQYRRNTEPPLTIQELQDIIKNYTNLLKTL